MKVIDLNPYLMGSEYIDVNKYMEECFNISKRRYKNKSDSELMEHIRSEVKEALIAQPLSVYALRDLHNSGSMFEYCNKNLKDSFPCEIADIFIFLCAFLKHKGINFNKELYVRNMIYNTDEEYHVRTLNKIDDNLQTLINNGELIAPGAVVKTVLEIFKDLFRISKVKGYNLIFFIELKNEFNKERRYK